MRPLYREASQPEVLLRGAVDGESTGLAGLHRPGVLVVDDDAFVRKIVQLGLEREGFDVWLAMDGWEAIDQYRTHRNDIGVVLLDIRMPGMDGPQTLAALRELNPEIVACFMSGNAGAYEFEELHQQGAAHVIAKPFKLEKLARVLRLALEYAGAPQGLPRPMDYLEEY
jgi:CheY-like chemotaxis protein